MNTRMCIRVSLFCLAATMLFGLRVERSNRNQSVVQSHVQSDVSPQVGSASFFMRDAFGGRQVDGEVVEKTSQVLKSFSGITPREFALMYDVHALWAEYLKTNSAGAFLSDPVAQAQLSNAWLRVEEEMGADRYKRLHESMRHEYVVAYDVSANDPQAASVFVREAPALRAAILGAETRELYVAAQKNARERLREIFTDQVFELKRELLEQALGAPLGSGP